MVRDMRGDIASTKSYCLKCFYTNRSLVETSPEGKQFLAILRAGERELIVEEVGDCYICKHRGQVT
jgi:hypothetical protein